MSATVAALQAKIGLDKSEMDAGLAEASSALGAFALKMTSALQGAARSSMAAVGQELKQLGSQFTAVGRQMTMGLTLPLVGIGAASLKAFSDFDKGLRDADSVAHLTTAQFKKMHDGLLNIAHDGAIRQMPQDLAAGMYRVLSAGYNVKQSLDIVKEGAIGATGGMTTAADSTLALIKVMTAYKTSNLSAKDAMNLMIQEVNTGVNKFPELTAGIGTAAAMSAKFGVSAQDMMASLGTMSKTLSMPEAFTSYENLLRHIIAPSKQAAKAMDEMGIAHSAAALKAQGLTGWLEKVQKVTGGNADSLKKIMPEFRGMRGLLALLNDDMKDYKDHVDGMKHANDGMGAAMENAKRQNMGFESSLTNLKKEMTIAAIEIGELLAPAISKLAGYIKIGVEWFEKLSTPIKQTAIVLGIVAAAIGPVLLVLGGLATGIGTIITVATSVIEVLSVVAAAITGPVLAAIALVVAGVALLWAAWREDWGHIREHTADVINWLKTNLMAGWNYIKDTAIQIWGALTAWWKKNGEEIKASFKSVFGEIEDFCKRVWPQIRDVIVFAWTGIKFVLTTGLEFLQRIFANTWDNIKGILSGVWKVLVGIVKVAWALLAGIITVGLDLLTGNWKKAGDDLKRYSQMAWDGICDIFRGGLQAIVNIVKGGVQLLWNAGKELVQGLIGGITNSAPGVSSAINHVQSAVSGEDFHDMMAHAKAVGHLVPKHIAASIRASTPHVAAAAADMGKEAKKHANQMVKDAKETAEAISRIYDSIYEKTHNKYDTERRAAQNEYKDAVNTDPGNTKLQAAAAQDLRLKLKAIGEDEQKDTKDRYAANLSFLADYVGKVKARNQEIVQFAYETGQMDVSQFRAVLANKLAGLKQYSTEWIATTRQIMGIDREQTELVAKAMTDSMTAIKERMALEAQEAAAALAHEETVFRFTESMGLISKAQFKAFLVEKQNGVALFSEEWMKYTKEIFDFDAAQMAKNLKDTKAWSEQVDQLIADQKRPIADLAQSLTNIMSDAMGSIGKGFGGFFGSILSGFEQMLQQMAMKWLQSQIMNLVGRALTHVMGGSDTSGWGELFGGARAGGGSVSSGKAYLVGENGPEMFVPGTSGGIMPNHALAGAGGGGGSIVVHMTVNGVSDAGSFKQSEQQILSDLTRNIDYARRRGGV